MKKLGKKVRLRVRSRNDGLVVKSEEKASKPLRHSALDAESQKTKVVWENEEVRKKSEIAGQGEQ